MNTDIDTEVKTAKAGNGWKALIRPVLSYVIAIGLIVTAPALLAGAVLLALLTGDATIIGIGLSSGAVIGVVGALSLLWCLAGPRGRSAGEGQGHT